MGLTGLSSAVAAERWYTTEQIEQGRAVFQEHCASCHGGEAQGLVEDWQTADENGRYPPPPLNGSAHAWHHALPVLRRTIHKGNVELGGQMPGFVDKIGELDTDAAIAYFQSFWSDEVYATWLENSGPVKVAEEKVEEAAGGRDTAAVTARLAARLPRGARLGPPEQTPIGGVYQVKAGNAYVYLSGDGRYALIGDMLDLTTGENLTERRRAGDRLGLLKGFPDADKVVFMAQGEERARLDIFTDTSCPYCRKLHAEVPQLRNAGVTVRYLPFPRGGTKGSGYADLKAVWCAADRAAAMDIAKGTAQGRLGDGDCDAAGAVDRGYLLGQQVGITGTPAILLPDGRLQAGYLPAKQLIELLGLARAR
jgi:thiol:disulfide interchange protein DsbC